MVEASRTHAEAFCTATESRSRKKDRSRTPTMVEHKVFDSNILHIDNSSSSLIIINRCSIGKA